MGAFVFEYFDPVKSCIFSVTTMPPEAERQVDEAVCDIFFQLSINTDSVPHGWERGIAEGDPSSALYVPFDSSAPTSALSGGAAGPPSTVPRPPPAEAAPKPAAPKPAATEPAVPKPAVTEEGEGAAAEAGADNNSGADAVRSTMPVLTPPTIATPPRPPPPAMQAPSAPPMRPTTSSLPSSLRDEIVRGKSLSPVASRDVGAHTPSPRPSTALASNSNGGGSNHSVGHVDKMLRRAAQNRRNSVNGHDSTESQD